MRDFLQFLRETSYPGRGIVVGRDRVCYFIMGRSANSRNRVFTEKNGEIFTEPFDASKVEDPSLIIYAAVRSFENKLIVTNGNQTDTIYDGLKAGGTFESALETREFEPDRPNWTPRISGMLTFAGGDFTYKMSILKSGDAAGTFCNRYTFSYGACAGLGHFIHTYEEDGNPLPSFRGEPRPVSVTGNLDEFTERVWESLNENNKVSLFTSFVNLETGEAQSRIVNKHQ